jgi:hypothetical protein
VRANPVPMNPILTFFSMKKLNHKNLLKNKKRGEFNSPRFVAR